MLQGDDFKKAASELDINKEALHADIKREIDKLETNTQPRVFRKKRLVLVSALLSLLLIFGSITVYAAFPSVRQFLNLFKTGSSEVGFHLDAEYLEIYTAADLDAVRNDLKANYKMMADIVFTDADFGVGGAFEGGWSPIGDRNNPFYGIFNGNGHVIYNLQINNPGEHAGLFGVIGARIFSPEPDDLLMGMVLNLGISGGKIVTSGEADYVGSIAGVGTYIVGCFSENVLIEAKANDTAPISVGGIIGKAQIIDSCYSSAQITLTGKEKEPMTFGTCDVVGGLAGEALTAVTSYFTGTIQAEKYHKTGEILATERFIPYVISSVQIQSITNIMEQKIDGFSFNVFQSLYSCIGYPEDETAENAREEKKWTDSIRYIMQNYLLFSIDEEIDAFYILPMDINRSELDRLENILLRVFDKEAIKSEFLNAGLKVGMLYCYNEETGRAASFDGFNFDTIWTQGGDLPSLAIFKK
ncbi:MAG: hypothetical protein GX303_07475 [Clostridiales bacterium]|nr:hypothetical protein [Clostridiales bacterium]